jgi:hypothetical protein
VTDSYPTATICGTMRLFDNMLTVADELTRQGSIVLMPFTRKGGNQVAVNQRIAALEKRDGKTYDHGGYHLNATPITGTQLDKQHRAKIEMADLVVVVTNFASHIWGSTTDSRELYFGESTTGEMDYAHRLSKPIKLARVERSDYRDYIHWLELAASR